MNNGQQGGQPSGTQGTQQPQQQQAQRKITIFRPEQMRGLPEQFSNDEKLKWEAGLKNLWAQMTDNDAQSQPHLDAKRKLFEFSRTLTTRIQNTRAQQVHQQAAAGAAARPPSQGQPPQASAGENTTNSNATQPPQQRPQPKISQTLLDHVNSFAYMPPAGTPDPARWVQEMKNKHLKALNGMEAAATRLQNMKEIEKKRNEEGKPFTPDEEKDFKQKHDMARKTHAECKAFVDNLRRQQEGARAAAGAAGAAAVQASTVQQVPANTSGGNVNTGNANANGAGNAPTQGQGPAPAPAAAAAPASNPVPAPTRPQMNVNQPANPALQHTQTVNGAIEAARNQQMGGARPAMQITMPAGLPVQQQMNNQNAHMHAQMPNNQASNAGQQPNIKIEGGAPAPINTAISQMQRGSLGGGGMTASPQSAVPRSGGMPQSAGPQGQAQGQIPQALSHTDALNQAARSYSNTAQTVMGHSHPNPSIPPRDQNISTNKMPIPKHLPDRATAAPVPVTMAPQRPSYTGGSNNIGNGVMNQAVIGNPPGPTPMAGDSEGILTSNKLNELVRQVTGGGNGLEGGQGLSPDVEQSVLQVADSFVDQVLQAACKNAKERGSKILEIRDIQLTLERGYNIRIPGYSSDEIRTVRKITPAGPWISKMSAVQAAKVTGGRNVE